MDKRETGGAATTEVIGFEGENGPDTVVAEKAGTFRDIEDMKRMGKEQLFKVYFPVPPVQRRSLTRYFSATLVS